MKYFIDNTPGREVVKEYVIQYPDMSSYELRDLIMTEHYESWMDDTTPSLKGKDTILSHMVRGIKSQM